MDDKNKSKNDEDIITLFKEIDIDTEDFTNLFFNLFNFSYEFKLLKDIELFLTFENFEILKKLSSKDNIKINLLLKNIYIDIIDNKSLYSKYLIGFESDKIKLLLEIIDECISLIKKLKGFIFDPKLFTLKKEIISLIKCIYINGKNKIENNLYIQKLLDLLGVLPKKFFSESFNKLNEDKNVFEIFKSQEEEKINIFEQNFAELNNYYEQFDIFKKCVECNLGDINYDSIENSENSENQEKEKKEKDIFDLNKVDFYQKYGLFLLKFCYFHRFIFLNEEEKDENKNEEESEEKEDDEEEKKFRTIFLFDKINIDDEIGENKEEKNNDNENNKKNNKKIENFMNKKLFISQTYSKEYKELIIKEINYYLNITKSIENEPKINKNIEKMKYYLNTIKEKSYYPLYINSPGEIIIGDQFTDSFSIKVPEGKKKIFYLETKINETMLIFIEYSLEEKSKDINFEINKYEMETNSYKPIFKEEKIEDNCKFFILCRGYSLYQIIFDNFYSWFTSKEIKYKVSLLKLLESEKEDIYEEENETKIYNNLEHKNVVPELKNGLGIIKYFNETNNNESYSIKINEENIQKWYNIDKNEKSNKYKNSQIKQSLENLSSYLKSNCTSDIVNCKIVEKKENEN